MIYEAAQREIVLGCRAGWIDMHKRDSNESVATLQLLHTTLRTLWVESEGGVERVNEEGGQSPKMDE